MKKLIGMMLATGIWAGVAVAQQPEPMTHAYLQAVDSEGFSAHDEIEFPFTIRGIILNDPEEMLPLEFNPDASSPPTGGQYQMFIQAVGDGDRGGTALYMAQRSFKPGNNNYEQGEWESEMARVLFDGNGRKFRKGDLIEVTANNGLYYNGKFNINEAHLKDPTNNFEIALIQANVGLPKAEAITLADLKDESNAHIFDQTRATGGEHYQGMRVRLDGIQLTDTNGWGQAAWADRKCWVTDETGRTFMLRMPLTDLGAPPTGVFSAIGILNQEDEPMEGYELFAQEIGPELKMTMSDGRPSLSFSTDYEDFVLEATDDLEGGVWAPVDLTPRMMIMFEDDGEADIRHYRLRKAD